jgi:hypothetical protein
MNRKTQLEKLDPWVAATEDDAPALLRMTETGPQILTPLFMAPRDDDFIVVACTIIAGPNDTRMSVCVPGMCGHYDCGGAVVVSLN